MAMIIPVAVTVIAIIIMIVRVIIFHGNLRVEPDDPGGGGWEGIRRTRLSIVKVLFMSNHARRREFSLQYY